MKQTKNGGDRPKEAQKESSYNIKVDGKYNYSIVHCQIINNY